MFLLGFKAIFCGFLYFFHRAFGVEDERTEGFFKREIGLAMKNRKNLTPAVQKFIEYLPFRETE